MIRKEEVNVTQSERYAELGLGVETAPGEPWMIHDALAPGFSPADESSRKSLLYFWQVADPQLVDEESPVRFAGFWKAGPGLGFRAQSHLTTQMFESHVRTARRISEVSSRPFDFALLTGDLGDTGHRIEVQWVIDILNGGVIDPDTGVDDDPIAGPGNDFNDPFVSAGIGVPWYPCLGNHDVLFNGSFTPTQEIQSAAVGTQVFDYFAYALGTAPSEGFQNGFRDGATPNAKVRTRGSTPPDPRRRIPTLNEWLTMFYEAPGLPTGHGLSASDVSASRGYYAFYPIPEKPIRMLVLNTMSMDPPTFSGAISTEQMMWLRRTLDESRAASELVIVVSHHRTGSFSDGSQVSAESLQTLLLNNEHVVAHITGHGHRNELTLVGGEGARGYWEIMTASVIDFPTQTRIWELVYEGEGFLSIYATNIDHNGPEDGLAHQGRVYASVHRAFTRAAIIEGYEDRKEARNMILRVKLSENLSASIEREDWPSVVESEHTLAGF